MNKATFLAIVRHALTFAGGLATARGVATTDEIEQGIGALVTLAGLGWSIYDKRARAATTPTPRAEGTP